MALLHLELLGDLRIRSEAGALITMPAKKSQALLAYLGMHPGQRFSRDKLSGLLWSSTGPDQARQSLRQTLSSLRKELGAVADGRKLLLEDGDHLGLDKSLVEADAAEFAALATATDEASLARAAELYRDDFLDGFTINEERFDQWVLAERDRLRRLALRVHAQLIELQSTRGAIDEAVATAQKSLRLDPLQEPIHRSLMRLFLQSNDPVNALQQYETCARLLRRELRIEPDAETKALHREIAQLRAKASLATPPAEAEAGDRQTVLVVEDNTLSRELTSALLKSAGYHVVVAKDGAEALMMLGRQPVDLLLLDVGLPFIDGHSLLQAVKENGVEVPAILISGLPGDEVEDRAFANGAADFIRKPVKNSVLLARVARVLKPE